MAEFERQQPSQERSPTHGFVGKMWETAKRACGKVSEDVKAGWQHEETRKEMIHTGFQVGTGVAAGLTARAMGATPIAAGVARAAAGTYEAVRTDSDTYFDKKVRRAGEGSIYQRGEKIKGIWANNGQGEGENGDGGGSDNPERGFASKVVLTMWEGIKEAASFRAFNSATTDITMGPDRLASRLHKNMLRKLNRSDSIGINWTSGQGREKATEFLNSLERDGQAMEHLLQSIRIETRESNREFLKQIWELKSVVHELENNPTLNRLEKALQGGETSEGKFEGQGALSEREVGYLEATIASRNNWKKGFQVGAEAFVATAKTLAVVGVVHEVAEAVTGPKITAQDLQGAPNGYVDPNSPVTGGVPEADGATDVAESAERVAQTGEASRTIANQVIGNIRELPVGQLPGADTIIGDDEILAVKLSEDGPALYYMHNRPPLSLDTDAGDVLQDARPGDKILNLTGDGSEHILTGIEYSVGQTKVEQLGSIAAQIAQRGSNQTRQEFIDLIEQISQDPTAHEQENIPLLQNYVAQHMPEGGEAFITCDDGGQNIVATSGIPMDEEAQKIPPDTLRKMDQIHAQVRAGQVAQELASPDTGSGGAIDDSLEQSLISNVNPGGEAWAQARIDAMEKIPAILSSDHPGAATVFNSLAGQSIQGFDSQNAVVVMIGEHATRLMQQNPGLSLDQATQQAIDAFEADPGYMSREVQHITGASGYGPISRSWIDGAGQQVTDAINGGGTPPPVTPPPGSGSGIAAPFGGGSIPVPQFGTWNTGWAPGFLGGNNLVVPTLGLHPTWTMTYAEAGLGLAGMGLGAGLIHQRNRRRRETRERDERDRLRDLGDRERSEIHALEAQSDNMQGQLEAKVAERQNVANQLQPLYAEQGYNQQKITESNDMKDAWLDIVTTINDANRKLQEVDSTFNKVNQIINDPSRAPGLVAEKGELNDARTELIQYINIIDAADKGLQVLSAQDPNVGWSEANKAIQRIKGNLRLMYAEINNGLSVNDQRKFDDYFKDANNYLGRISSDTEEAGKDSSRQVSSYVTQIANLTSRNTQLDTRITPIRTWYNGVNTEVTSLESDIIRVEDKIANREQGLDERGRNRWNPRGRTGWFGWMDPRRLSRGRAPVSPRQPVRGRVTPNVPPAPLP
jgi:hypothetical protein